MENLLLISKTGIIVIFLSLLSLKASFNSENHMLPVTSVHERSHLYSLTGLMIFPLRIAIEG